MVMPNQELQIHLSSLPIWDEAEDVQVRLETLQWRAKQIEECTEKLERKMKVEDDRPLSTRDGGGLEMLESVPRAGEEVFAMDNPGKPWLRCLITTIYRQVLHNQVTTIFKLSRKSDNQIIRANKFAVARIQNHGTQLCVSKRVIAGHDNENLLPGIIAQDCSEYNNYRYLVFMDDGTANYYKPEQVFPIVYQSKKPWTDFRQIGIANQQLELQSQHYFRQFPMRNLVKMRLGSEIDVQRNKDWVKAIVIAKDCDVIKVVYKNRDEEFLYRGSIRFIKTAAIVAELTGNSFLYMNPRLVKCIADYHLAAKKSIQEDDFVSMLMGHKGCQNISGNTARKSTGARIAPPRIKVSSHPDHDPTRSYKPAIEAVRSPPSSDEHKCSPDCVATEAGVDIIRDFMEICDLKVPLKLGWKRMLILAAAGGKTRSKTKQQIYAYVTPCKKILSKAIDIRRYLRYTNSKLDIDYFTLEREVDLSNTFEDRHAYYYEANMAVNRETGQPLENKYISVMNVNSREHLASDFIYNNQCFPHKLLEAKGFSFNEEFKSGCDCDDDCYMRVNCPCHRLNEELAGGTSRFRGELATKYQYKEKRLYEQVSTGIFECNSYCSCNSKCPNRVVQNGIRIRLQVRKTVDKGWGAFVLDDVPKGAFICTYAAEILDDADQYGDSDMYFADLDYMTVLEQQKMVLTQEDNDEDEGIAEVGKKRRHLLDSDSDSDMEMVVDRYFPRANSGFIKIHTLLNESQDYTLDARLQGNVGRFFNHSCDPNSFVQNVFIESHDPRFPHVAFFTKKNLQADDEITWNYNYKVDSIEGRQIDCNCGSSNCQGRIL